MATPGRTRSVNATGLTIGELWLFLGVALPVLAALLVPMPAVDLAYQLRAGAGILAGHGIPTTDTWTFTIAGTPWLDQQWGAQVLLAGVFQVGGWTGLAILRAALVGATFGLVMATLRSMGCASRPAALLALGGFVVAAPALALRPQLFAIVLFAATLAILADRARHPRRLWLLPIFAIAWANLHGSFPLIVILLGIGWLDEIGRVLVARAAIRPGHGPGRATDAIRGSTGLALLAGVSALATLITPFGVDVWRYVAHLASDPTVTSAVSEWRPPSPLDPAGALFYVSLVIGFAVALLRVHADRNRVRPATFAPIATLVVFGILGIVTGRGLAWWALILPISGAALAHDGGLTGFLPRPLKPLAALLSGPGTATAPRAARRSPLNTIVALLLILAGVALLPVWRPIGAAGVPAGVLSFAPQGIAAKLDAFTHERLPVGAVHVWVPQSWGSWIEFAAPDALVSVDSRIELYPATQWADIDVVASGGQGMQSVLESHGANLIVTAAGHDLPSSNEWGRVYQDADGSIWETAPDR